MIFILKPRRGLHGKNLKKWYRRVNYGLRGSTTIPLNWTDRPEVKVPINLLDNVMKSLHRTATQYIY